MRLGALAIGAVLLLGSGCGTLVSLFSDPFPLGGAAQDLQWIDDNGLFPAVLDFPLSLVADIALLPIMIPYAIAQWPQPFEYEPVEPEIRVAEIRRTLEELEGHLRRQLVRRMTPSWRIYLDRTGGIKNSWLLERQLLVENGRRELWSIKRKFGRLRSTGQFDDQGRSLWPDESKPGELLFSFSLDPNNDAPDRYVVRRPTASENYLHVPCQDGTVFTIDRYGNLEHRSTLPTEMRCDPVASDKQLFFSSGRLLHAFPLPVPLFCSSESHPPGGDSHLALSGERIFWATGDGQVVALKHATCETAWSKQTDFGAVTAPLLLHGEAARLYVAHGGQRVVACYGARDGRILWSRPTDSAVNARMLVGKDRLYAVTGSGVWAIATDSGAVLWKYAGANKLLALGKQHVYVRTGRHEIAVVRIRDGTRERAFTVPVLIEKHGLWYTNPYGPQLIIGAVYRDRVGMWVSLTEAR